MKNKKNNEKRIFNSLAGLKNVDITVSTSKLKETKEFYTKYLNFTVLKETPGYISFSPGPGEKLGSNFPTSVICG